MGLVKDNKLAIFIGIVLLAIICAVTIWASFEIATIKNRIGEFESASYSLNKSDIDRISTALSQKIDIPTPRDGFNGQDGKDGISIKGDKGEDSVSTVIERETIIQKELPPEKGEQGIPGQDAKSVELGISLLGNPIWKYDTDREWRPFTKVEVAL